MSYYIRTFSTSPAPSLDEMATALQAVAPQVSLENSSQDTETRAVVLVNGAVLAELEVSPQGSDVFEEEIEDFTTIAARAAGGESQVQNALNATRTIFAFRVLDQGRPRDCTLDMLDPVIDHYLALYPGILHAQLQGFYVGNEMILATG
tara:strand:- start:671 stop:1117 length:447 start_codon:yes stop_codon:yes gene_type:complete